MGSPKKNLTAKQPAQEAASETSPIVIESEPRQQGRRLVLKFIAKDNPELDTIGLRWNKESQEAFWQQGHSENPMLWKNKLPQALAVIFLDYLCTTERVGPTYFTDSENGGFATTLGNAITDKAHNLHDLLAERPAKGKPISRVKQVFGGKNVHGKEEGERQIFVQAEHLPPDCIEVYWGVHGKGPLCNPDHIRDLRSRVRRSLGIPVEPEQPRLPAGEGSPPKPPAPPPPEEKIPRAALPNFPELLTRKDLIAAALAEGKTAQGICLLLKAQEVVTTLHRVEEFCRAMPVSQPGHQPGFSFQRAEPKAPVPQAPEPAKPAEAKAPSQSATGKETPQPSLQEIAALAAKTLFAEMAKLQTPPQSPARSPAATKTAPPITQAPAPETKPAQPEPKSESSSESDLYSAGISRAVTHLPLPRIPAGLFEIQNPDALAWEDSMPLLDFGDGESEDDIWRIKDACEGVLVFGAPGSGKTSASGFAFASAFLSAGFGGLVLAAKPDEARRWRRLCGRYGRAEDCVVVTPDGPHKLNVLAYETQRPGRRLAMTDDLIAFFRVLIAIVSKRAAGSAKDDFWTNATNQLMRELFDVFLLAGEPLNIDSLTRFVAKAPEKPVVDWQAIPFFGGILAKAQKGVQSAEDERIYDRVLDYWTVSYPGIAPVTRSGIELGFTAMANALSGRGIHNLISSETTMTPEMILSGKIVLLDLPLKDCGQGGLLIQAAWKYLFQRAVERRTDKGLDTARPVFLWEDEGHLFFSQHDIDFQPTARDCRAAHVIISQSLHNFYQLGHNPHAVQGVFATMNTHVYHANGDLETNQWASDKCGTMMKTLVNVSISSQPKRPDQPKHWLLDMFKQEERDSTSSTSVNQHREKVFQPEAFSQLKKAGDGSCQAVILWVSHQFRCSGGKPFRVTVFEQDSDH